MRCNYCRKKEATAWCAMMQVCQECYEKLKQRQIEKQKGNLRSKEK